MGDENGVVRTDGLWRLGGAVRSHRTDVVRRRHLANAASDLEPAFWRHHRRMSHDRSNCRWDWDAVPTDRASGVDRSRRRLFAFLAGLHPRHPRGADRLCDLRQLFRTGLLTLRRDCPIRCNGSESSTGCSLRPSGAAWTWSLRHLIYRKSDGLPSCDLRFGSSVDSAQSDVLGHTLRRSRLHSRRLPFSAIGGLGLRYGS